MDNFTYETENTRDKRENSEWDNTWITHARDGETPRILYIGDSISCATRRLVTRASEYTMLVDGYGTSKALDNPLYYDAIRLFAEDQGYRSAIIFNNGLHGWHLSDDEEYPYYYEEAIKFLLKEFPDTPLFVVLTTSVRNAEREERVKLRNKAAVRIAEKYGLPVVDLYSVSVEISELHSDSFHFNDEGSEILAQQIVKDVKNVLE